MPLDPQCSTNGGCLSPVEGALVVQDGCPAMCVGVRKQGFVDEDGKLYPGVCDPDVYDELLGATAVAYVATEITFGDALPAGPFLGYGEDYGIIVLLTMNEADRLTAGDVIESCNGTGETMLVTEISGRSVTVRRGWLDTEQMDWPKRGKALAYRIFREAATVDPDGGTLCYQWTPEQTVTVGPFLGFFELTLVSGKVLRFPRRGAYGLQFT